MRHVEGLYSSSGFVSSRVPLLPGMDSSGCTANRGNQRVQVPSTGVHNLASTRDENSLSHQSGYEGQLLVRPPEATLDLMNLEAPVTTPNVAPKMQSQVHATGSVLKMPVMHSQAHPTGPVLKMPVMQPPTHAIHATVTVPAVPNMQTQHAISPDPLALTTIDHAVSGSQVATNAGLVGNSGSAVPKQLSQSAATLESMPLIDLLSPIAESPFRPCAVPHEGQSTPRTPRVGTSMGTSYTPKGTRVPEGPPPVTPPPCPPPSVEPEASRSVSFGPVTYTPLPSSPIPAPPKPPGDAYDSTQLGTGTSGHSRSEEPSRLVMQLPVLSISDVAEASVVTGDWLARLGPVMRSLSPGAPGWWNRTIEVATSFYQRWLLADPIQRLALKTEAVSYVWDHGPLARVEERGSILLLQALPQDLQTEAVSTRALSSSALVFLTMSRFQPGGTAEKSTILAYLTQPSADGPQGIVSNHAALRKWERLFRRCRELGLQAPDPSLLIRALDGLGKIINNKSHQAGFRLSSFRHEQQLDVCPTEAKALHYCQLLTAELETLLLAYQDSGKQQRLSVLQGPSAKEGRETPSPKTPNPKAPSHKPAGKASPHVKPGSLTPKHVPTSAATQSGPLDDKGICKFFSSPGGCRYGRSCVHPHSTLSPQDDRCFNCGAVGHTMTACERPTKPRPSQAVAAAEPLHKSGVPKGNQKGRRPKGRKLEASQASGESAADKGEENGEFENSLKTIACEESHVLASLKEIGPGGGRGLIDGGATHCLRYGAPGEFRLAKPVSVKLASGTSNELRMSAVGTLLSQDSQIQPIIPMGLCAEVLGCKILWQQKVCKVLHPTMGKLDVEMNRGCPEIERDVCLGLIAELENARSEAMLKAISGIPCGKGSDKMAWGSESDRTFLESLREWVAETYDQVPDRVRARLVPAGPHSEGLSGLNRHTRRRLSRGSCLVHLFSGMQKWGHPNGTPSVALDLKRGHDVKDDALFFYLLQLARQGKISYLVAGPPCRTFSPLRTRGEGPSSDGGPRVVRARYGEARFGLKDLSPEEQELVDGDSILFLRTLLLAEVAASGLRERAFRAEKEGDCKSQRLYFAMEHPDDPEEFLTVSHGKGQAGARLQGYPTVWVWDEVKQFAKRHGLKVAEFHQGLLGHPKVKPSRMLVTSGKLWESVHNLKVPKHGLWKPREASLVRDRIAQSGSWSQWAPQLVEFIKDSLRDWSKGDEHIDRDDHERMSKLEHLLVANGLMRPTQAAYVLRGLSAKGISQFRKHCLAGHRPWRSDCAACLDAMAFSKPHRRLARSRVCSLSFDVSGPHRALHAEDQDIAKPKYFIVGCYNFPVFDPHGEGSAEEGAIPGEMEGLELLKEEAGTDRHEDHEDHPGEDTCRVMTRRALCAHPWLLPWRFGHPVVGKVCVFRR